MEPMMAGQWPAAQEPAPVPPEPARPTPEREARLFWRMRGRMAWTLARQTLATGRLRLALVVLLSATLWLALFWLCLDGFLFLRSGIPYEDLRERTVSAMFGMFFFALAVMLTFSSGIILYGSLFRSQEVPLLLTIPVRDDRIFLAKFQETILLSSWGFVLLGSPMLIAYGLVAMAPWYFYAMLLPMLVAFTYIPAGIGALACLGIVRFLPDRRKLLLVVLAVVTVGSLGLLGWSLVAAPADDLLTPDWFLEVLGRLRIVEHRLLPSWWLSAGLLQAASHQVHEGVMFLALLVANALALRQVSALAATKVYRAAYSRLHGLSTARRRAKPSYVDQLLEALPAVPRPARLLILKDFRLFRRDPVQWSQVLIFLGLLAGYFFNIRWFHYDQYYAGWVTMVSFLNVSVVGLLLSTFTTRFIFPMISLEGRRFWVLGLLPVPRQTILWSKFGFAVVGSILPCSLLILLSDLMLGVSATLIVNHQVTCAMLCGGLSGIAVGLGARLPNLRETSPSRIAAGFGGTLNLVLSTLYIVLVLLLATLPAHIWPVWPGGLARGEAAIGSVHPGWQPWLELWYVAGLPAAVILAGVATVVPLWVGVRAFSRMEF